MLLFILGILSCRADLSQLQLLPGFSIEYFAVDVPSARSMTLSQSNTSLLYVGSNTNPGNVYCVVQSAVGSTNEVVTIISGLNTPDGVAWMDGSLFVGELNRLIRFQNIDQTFANNPKYTVLMDNIPSANGGWHGAKNIRFGPDGYLYMPVGAPCNYCLHKNGPGDPPTELTLPFDTLTRVGSPFDGSNWTVIAHGIRNSVGMDWDPLSGNMFFTDNGRDNMGPNYVNKPWDELNVLPSNAPLSPLPHYGFPFCYGYGWDNQTGGPDHIFNNGSCDPYIGALYELGPHVAPLGMRFYAGSMMPQLVNGILVAEHGSWNRPSGELTGYRVVWLTLDETRSKVVNQTVFVQGWLDSDKATYWGRPVDIEELPDGSILISDDNNNAIYRVTYADV